MAAPDNLFSQMLDRIVAIHKTITGMGNSVRRVWQLPSGPWPMTINFTSREVPDYTQGHDYERIIVQVTMRLLGGPAELGDIGQSEDNVNDFDYALLKKMARYTNLEAPLASGEPDTAQSFDFLEAGTPVTVVPSGAITQFNYGGLNDAQVQFIGKDYTLQAVFFMKKK